MEYQMKGNLKIAGATSATAILLGFLAVVLYNRGSIEVDHLIFSWLFLLASAGSVVAEQLSDARHIIRLTGPFNFEWTEHTVTLETTRDDHMVIFQFEGRIYKLRPPRRFRSGDNWNKKHMTIFKNLEKGTLVYGWASRRREETKHW